MKGATKSPICKGGSWFKREHQIISYSKLDANLLSRYSSSEMQFAVGLAVGVQFPAV
jgi:hypothetical protein